MKQVHSHKDVSVAVLGIGLMGERLAVRLLAAGYSLTAWNRSPEKAQALVPHGARVTLTAAEAVRDSRFVILMLENGRVVGDVLFEQGVAGALQPGAVVIDMSSIGPQEARDHAQRLAELGVQHLDAQVSGGTLGAERGSLAIMCGGEQQTFDQAQELFSALGRPVRVGPHGAGQLAKRTDPHRSPQRTEQLLGLVERLLLATAHDCQRSAFSPQSATGNRRIQVRSE